MKKLQFTIALALLAFFSLSIQAAEQKKQKSSPISFAVELKNSHIWRGFDVSSSALIDANLRLSAPSKTFSMGIWASSSFDSKYREFNYYAAFNKNGFSIELWDILNFSNDQGLTNVFNYDSKSTLRFTDLSLAYQFNENFPLKLYWATIVYGNDRNRKGDNRYSSFLQASYPIFSNRAVDLEAGIAAAFSFTGQESLYAPKAGIVDIHLTASKELKLGNYSLPISLTTFWNPLLKRSYYTIAFQIVQF